MLHDEILKKEELMKLSKEDMFRKLCAYKALYKKVSDINDRYLVEIRYLNRKIEKVKDDVDRLRMWKL